MAPAPYPDFSWFIRAVRVLPVVAGAALVGGAIGGASIFAIDSALTAPPRQDLRAEASKSNEIAAASAPSPIRTIDAPVINPSPAVATPAPVQAQTVPTAQLQTASPAPPTPQTQVQAAPAAPAQPTAWPDALSRAHTQTPAASEAATPQSAPAAALAPDNHGQDDSARAAAANPPAESQAVADPKSATGTAPPKRRALISRTKQPKGNGSESADNASAKARRVYDYYGDTRDDEDRDDQGAGSASVGTALANVHLPRDARNAAPRTRVVTRHQVPVSSDRSDQSDAASRLPQPRPAFLGGLFGGDDR